MQKISGVDSDDELYDIVVKEYKEGEEKSFLFVSVQNIFMR